MQAFWRKWGVCLLLLLATTPNYLDHETLSILAPTLQDEMHLDTAALGWLFSAFYYSYTFSQLAVGLLLDRSHLRWAFGLAVLAWSVVSGLTGLAQGFIGLLICRLLLGVAESPNWPAALRIVARALPHEDRSLGNGIFTGGTSIGALIAPGLILGLSAAAGWRWTFVIVASLGFLWLGAWLQFTRRPELSPVWTDPLPGRSKDAARPWAGVAELVRDRHFQVVWLVAILINPCLYFNVNWLPTYLKQQRALSDGRSLGWILTAIFVGLDLGYLACGAAVLKLTRAGRPTQDARRLVMLAATSLVCLSAVVPALEGLTETVAALVIVNFGMGLWITSYLTMAQEVSASRVSTTTGLLGGSGSLVGAIAMWAVGSVTKQTSSFAIPFVVQAVVVICAA